MVRGEMSRTRIACVPFLVVGAVWLLAGPAFAGKEAIRDQDLDRVSAAGVCGAGSHVCNASEDPGAAQTSMAAQDAKGAQVSVAPRYLLTLGEGAQQGIRALVLNNAVGTSQVANAINISGMGAR
jgi:hypothetical protein